MDKLNKKFNELRKERVYSGMSDAYFKRRMRERFSGEIIEALEQENAKLKAELAQLKGERYFNGL